MLALIFNRAAITQGTTDVPTELCEETEVALSITPRKLIPVGLAVETDLAIRIPRVPEFWSIEAMDCFVGGAEAGCA